MTKEMHPSHCTGVLSHSLAHYGWKKNKISIRWYGVDKANSDHFDDVRKFFVYASPKSLQESCCCN